MIQKTFEQTIEHYKNDLATYYQDVESNKIYDGAFDPESALNKVMKWTKNDGINVTDLNKVDSAEMLYNDFREWKNS